MSDGKNPWDFGQNIKPGKKETTAAYRALKIFLEMGTGRNLKECSAMAGISLDMARSYSSRFNWSERAAYYDAHMIELWGQQVKDEFESNHKKELMKFRKDQQKRAASLGKVADLLIEVTTGTLEDMVASGEAVDTQQLAAVARTAATLSEAAMNTAAAALGVDDLMEAIAPEVE